MIDLLAARTITPADITLPATIHIDITLLLETGPTRGAAPTGRNESARDALHDHRPEQAGSVARVGRPSWRR